MKKYIIAIGGNALEENKNNLKKIFKTIAETVSVLISKGDKVVIVFGNGPQIGKLMMKDYYARNISEEYSMDECVAMSQALIGYQLEKEIGNYLTEQRCAANIVNIVTQVEVSEHELREMDPTKPVGCAYSEEEAARITSERPDIVMKKDGIRGYRRVVVSPKPQRIIEIETVKNLIRKNTIVIAGGGGGIPVIIKDGNRLIGVNAVVDKDYTAELIAEEINADFLLLLTGVEYVMLNYGTDHEKILRCISKKEAKQFEEECQFSEGSMLPKVNAALKFVNSGNKRKAVIGMLEKLPDIINGKSGTLIQND